MTQSAPFGFPNGAPFFHLTLAGLQEGLKALIAAR